jgi:hypothetical protein
MERSTDRKSNALCAVSKECVPVTDPNAPDQAAKTCHLDAPNPILIPIQNHKQKTQAARNHFPTSLERFM